MEIWPAIDLLGGKCVRLQQGDYDRDTVFSDDPAGTALQWVEQGARRLHLVDLDGAKSGSLINEPSVRAIVSSVNVPCQLGGGVRDQATIERLCDLGVDRLIVGTAALKNPEWFAQMCDRFPKRLVLGIDARNGMVATEGWLHTSTTSAIELAQDIQWRTPNVAAIVYTDISRDGMLSGPNFDALHEMQLSVSIPVIASGGVTTLDDIDRLLQQKTHGAIIGRAIYEGRLDLKTVVGRSEG